MISGSGGSGADPAPGPGRAGDKKLYTMAENVMAPDCEDRPGCLLDALALSEALLCTQAGYETGYHIGQDSGDALTRPEPEAGLRQGPGRWS